MYEFLPINGFKQTDPKDFDLNKYTSNSSKGCVLEVDLEYSKELRKLHNDYSLAPDKVEIKREMMSEYQLKIANLYNIPTGIFKKLVPKLEKYNRCKTFKQHKKLFKMDNKTKLYVAQNIQQ